MKYDRLIAFGCSFTFGQGLKDCYNPSTGSCPQTPSRYAWPNKLAELLHINNIINKSLPGASNKSIWNAIINFDFNDNDLVCICWTYPDRWCILNTKRDAYPKPIGPWISKQPSVAYYEHLYNETDSMIDLNLRMHHINCISQQQNIFVVNTSMALFEYEQYTWNDTRLLKTDFHGIMDQHPLALDNAHPGPDAHIHFATEIHNEIIGDINE